VNAGTAEAREAFGKSAVRNLSAGVSESCERRQSGETKEIGRKKRKKTKKTVALAAISFVFFRSFRPVPSFL
jgi:hypothetical protein